MRKLIFRASQPPESNRLDGSLDDLTDTQDYADRWIIVGPWISEVGFELLYWIPFVRWLVGHHDLSRSKIIVLSRGGTASWYYDITRRYIDIFDLMSVEEFRDRNAKRSSENQFASQKQLQVSPLEDELLRRALGKINKSSAIVVHPGIMYRHFSNFWEGLDGWQVVESCSRRKRFNPGAVSLSPEMSALVDGLPDRFTAVKFYSRPTFPCTAVTQEIVGDIAARLAAQGPVLSLNFGLQVDDHEDFVIPDLPNIHRLSAVPVPSENLAVQSAIIARCSGLVGTYGGFCYLPMMYGVHSVGLYLPKRSRLADHLTVVGRTGRALNATCSVVDARTYRLLS